MVLWYAALGCVDAKSHLESRVALAQMPRCTPEMARTERLQTIMVLGRGSRDEWLKAKVAPVGLLSGFGKVALQDSLLSLCPLLRLR